MLLHYPNKWHPCTSSSCVEASKCVGVLILCEVTPVNPFTSVGHSRFLLRKARFERVGFFAVGDLKQLLISANKFPPTYFGPT
ncbi:hypothetical protein MTCD1_02090 [Colwellia marinimaniae]|uniref:Uncharacterized protein n=1 Tax=Colwellia marinimaniae TaxID=1513592 RepID=A0ABQ0MVS5_9GAMM|nr:hypothetical protein MTCD1_02090 [Colwellia marinimaniae]